MCECKNVDPDVSFPRDFRGNPISFDETSVVQAKGRDLFSLLLEVESRLRKEARMNRKRRAF